MVNEYKTLGVIGAGDLGEQIAHYAIDDGHYKNIVYFDDWIKDEKVAGFSVLGDIDSVFDQYNKGVFDELIIAIGYKHIHIRKKIFNIFYNKIPFGTIVHSSAWIDSTSKIEKGCVIYPRCEIDQNSVVKSNTILNIGCSIAHDSIIDEHCILAPKVSVAGFVSVGKECILGINSTIVDNVSIVEKTQIGAGSVVLKSINRAGVYYGTPAKFVRA